MSEHRSVYRWQCCKCGGDNSYGTDQGCAFCCNHWRSSCCYVYSSEPPVIQASRPPAIALPVPAQSQSPPPVPLIDQNDNQPAESLVSHTEHSPNPLSTPPLASGSPSQQLELPPDQSSGYIQQLSGLATSSEHLGHTPSESIPSPLRLQDVGQDVGASFSNACRRVLASVNLRFNASWLSQARLLVVMGLLEPALDQNKTRLRWRCHCGDSLYSDIIELHEGGIAELVDKMQRSSGVKVHTAQYNHQASNRQYTVPRPDIWLRNAATKVGSALRGSWRSFSGCLPQHNEACAICATTPCASSSNLSSQQKTLHLSMCINRTQRRKIVHQGRVDNLETDRQLLCFLQKQYTTYSSRFSNLLHLKSVEKIVFVKYLLPMNGIVDVQRCNSTRPNQKHCYCIPPPKKVGVEYDYRPSPPKTHPPISPEYLASWFTCMKDIPKVDKDQECWILNQLPKRTCGVLEGRKEDPAEGWGIYFVESWDRTTITLTIFVIFLVASLLFGVLWWKFQFDIQGGFGVSAYMGTVCTLLIAVIVTQMENKE